MLLKDKVCVVTGAASPRGIGRANVELALAHGAQVVLIDISERLDEAVGALANSHSPGSVLGVRCDISSREACMDAARIVLEKFERVDAIIHCAALIQSGTYDTISERDFDTVISVNLTGAFNVARAFAPGMVARQSGSIVNVASVAAQRGGGLFGGAHYAASKGGVLSLTKSLARELGSSGIRVNAVCPSLIETDFVTSAFSQDHIRNLTSSVPLGRPGTPNEVASTCLFLASDLSSYITGATLDVNGGSHIH